jgi:hypothetical protein
MVFSGESESIVEFQLDGGAVERLFPKRRRHSSPGALRFATPMSRASRSASDF